ncbi:MAG: adenylyl-sulfate kinase [Planctomycetes bacterium]|nr:adenylyl-sulfate kinase [Planctomycetota bacterium]
MEQAVRIVIVGHVDHGKSTLIGRLFLDTGRLPKEKLDAIERIAKARGMQVELANLMDAFQAERDQNITIDTAQIWFKTDKRMYVIIDAPGHREFVKNMVTGAASADAAILVIDASEGVQEQTRMHAYILKLLGLSQIIVCVNKMDLVDHSEKRYNEVKDEITNHLATLGITPMAVVPISAFNGDGVAHHSDKLSWYQGATMLGGLDDFVTIEAPAEKPLRFVLQDVYRFDERRILAGRVESGRISVGEKLFFSPSKKVGIVKSIERWNAPESNTANAGESIGVTLVEQIYVDRGEFASNMDTAPTIGSEFRASIFSLSPEAIHVGDQFKLKLATEEVTASVTSIHEVMDTSTLQVFENAESRGVQRYDSADVTFSARRPLAFDSFSDLSSTGRFVLVKDYRIIAGGIIKGAKMVDRSSYDVTSQNITWSAQKITADQRSLRHGYKGAIVWFTGLPASGKSTLATALEEDLFSAGYNTYVLDGDNVRYGLSSDLGFAEKDRDENIRRVGEVAHLLADAGLIVIVAFISPMRAQRERARGSAGRYSFIEVFVDTPVDECRRRDPKGLYEKARAGEITNFTGVDAPYEPPLEPEITIRTVSTKVPEAIGRIRAKIEIAVGKPAN